MSSFSSSSSLTSRSDEKSITKKTTQKGMKSSSSAPSASPSSSPSPSLSSSLFGTQWQSPHFDLLHSLDSFSSTCPHIEIHGNVNQKSDPKIQKRVFTVGKSENSPQQISERHSIAFPLKSESLGLTSRYIYFMVQFHSPYHQIILNVMQKNGNSYQIILFKFDTKQTDPSDPSSPHGKMHVKSDVKSTRILIPNSVSEDLWTTVKMDLQSLPVEKKTKKEKKDSEKERSAREKGKNPLSLSEINRMKRAEKAEQQNLKMPWIKPQRIIPIVSPSSSPLISHVKSIELSGFISLRSIFTADSSYFTMRDIPQKYRFNGEYQWWEISNESMIGDSAVRLDHYEEESFAKQREEMMAKITQVKIKSKKNIPNNISQNHPIPMSSSSSNFVSPSLSSHSQSLSPLRHLLPDPLLSLQWLYSFNPQCNGKHLHVIHRKKQKHNIHNEIMSSSGSDEYAIYPVGEILVSLLLTPPSSAPSSSSSSTFSMSHQHYYPGHTEKISHIEISPQSQLIATSQWGINPNIRIWKMNHHSDMNSHIPFSLLSVLVGFHSDLRSFCFSFDETLFAAVGKDERGRQFITIWEIIKNKNKNPSEKSLDHNESDDIIEFRPLARQTCDVSVDKIYFPPISHDITLISIGLSSIRFWRLKDHHLSSSSLYLGEWSRLSFIDMMWEKEHGDEKDKGKVKSDGYSPRCFVSTTTGSMMVVNYGERVIEGILKMGEGRIDAMDCNSAWVVTGENRMISSSSPSSLTDSVSGILRVWTADLSDFWCEISIPFGINSLQILLDGLGILIGTKGNEMIHMDLTSRKTRRLMSGHGGRVNDIDVPIVPSSSLSHSTSSLSPSSSLFGTTSTDGSIRIWSTHSPSPLYEFLSPTDIPLPLLFSPRFFSPSSDPLSSLLFVGFSSGCMRILHVESTSQIGYLQIFNNHQGVEDITCGSGGYHQIFTVYVVGSKGSVTMIQLMGKEWKVGKSIELGSEKGKESPSPPHVISLSPKGEFLAVCTRDTLHVTIIHPLTLEILYEIPISPSSPSTSISSLSFSSPTSLVILLTTHRFIHFPLSPSSCQYVNSGVIPHDSPSSLSLSHVVVPHTRYLAVGTSCPSVRIMDFFHSSQTETESQTFFGPLDGSLPSSLSSSSLRSPISFSSCGKYLISSGGDHIALWKFNGKSPYEGSHHVSHNDIKHVRQSSEVHRHEEKEEKHHIVNGDNPIEDEEEENPQEDGDDDGDEYLEINDSGLDDIHDDDDQQSTHSHSSSSSSHLVDISSVHVSPPSSPPSPLSSNSSTGNHHEDEDHHQDDRTHDHQEEQKHQLGSHQQHGHQEYRHGKNDLVNSVPLNPSPIQCIHTHSPHSPLDIQHIHTVFPSLSSSSSSPTLVSWASSCGLYAVATPSAVMVSSVYPRERESKSDSSRESQYIVLDIPIVPSSLLSSSISSSPSYLPLHSLSFSPYHSPSGHPPFLLSGIQTFLSPSHPSHITVGIQWNINGQRQRAHHSDMIHIPLSVISTKEMSSSLPLSSFHFLSPTLFILILQYETSSSLIILDGNSPSSFSVSSVWHSLHSRVNGVKSLSSSLSSSPSLFEFISFGEKLFIHQVNIQDKTWKSKQFNLHFHDIDPTIPHASIISSFSLLSSSSFAIGMSDGNVFVGRLDDGKMEFKWKNEKNTPIRDIRMGKEAESVVVITSSSLHLFSLSSWTALSSLSFSSPLVDFSIDLMSSGGLFSFVNSMDFISFQQEHKIKNKNPKLLKVKLSSPLDSGRKFLAVKMNEKTQEGDHSYLLSFTLSHPLQISHLPLHSSKSISNPLSSSSLASLSSLLTIHSISISCISQWSGQILAFGSTNGRVFLYSLKEEKQIGDTIVLSPSSTFHKNSPLSHYKKITKMAFFSLSPADPTSIILLIGDEEGSLFTLSITHHISSSPLYSLPYSPFPSVRNRSQSLDSLYSAHIDQRITNVQMTMGRSTEKEERCPLILITSEEGKNRSSSSSFHTLWSSHPPPLSSSLLLTSRCDFRLLTAIEAYPRTNALMVSGDLMVYMGMGREVNVVDGRKREQIFTWAMKGKGEMSKIFHIDENENHHDDQQTFSLLLTSANDGDRDGNEDSHADISPSPCVLLSLKVSASRAVTLIKEEHFSIGMNIVDIYNGNDKNTNAKGQKLFLQGEREIREVILK